MGDADDESHVGVDLIELDVLKIRKVGKIASAGRDVGTAGQQFSDEGFFNVGDVLTVNFDDIRMLSSSTILSEITSLSDPVSSIA